MTGLNDNSIYGGGGVNYNVMGVASGTDPNYNDLNLPNIQVNNQPTNVPAILVSRTLLYTTITGGQDAFNVTLNCQPGQNPVTVSLASMEPNEGSLSQTSLVFTSANWDVAQTVTVTGLNDGLGNGTQTYQITGSASGGNSGGTSFNGVTMTPITVINSLAGISVTPLNVTTTQAGGTGTFSVALTSQPSANVTVTLVNPEPSQGSLSTTSLLFTPTDWSTPQTVTVTGVNNNIAAGNQTYLITGSAASSDSAYNGLTMAPVTVTNLETDVPGVASYLSTPPTLVTSEAGASSNVSFALITIPADPVTVQLSLSDSTQGTLSTTALTFTPADWNIPQTVTVTGLDNHIAGGSQSYQIEGTASSTDPNYNGLSLSPVAVVNEDTDAATTTTVVSSVGPTSTYGQSVTFTATVSATGSTPTGSVIFYDGTTELGTITLGGGSAAYTTTFLSAGTHSITADYVAGPHFADSASAVLMQTVNPATLTVTAEAATKAYGRRTPRSRTRSRATSTATHPAWSAATPV